MTMEIPVVGSLGWGEKVNNNFTELQQVIDSLSNYLKKTTVVNNYTTEDQGYILDARVGSSLFNLGLYYKGSLSTLGVTDFDGIVTSGIYSFGNTTTMNNSPNMNQGILICYNIAEGNIIQQAIEISTNIIKQRTGYDDTLTAKKKWSDWKRTSSTTNVQDKEKSTGILDNNMGKYNYYIKDGICTVEFKDIAGDTANITLAETSNLPIPILASNGILENNGVMVGSINVSDEGKITCHKNSSNLGYGNVMYQIDESRY